MKSTTTIDNIIECDGHDQSFFRGFFPSGEKDQWISRNYDGRQNDTEIATINDTVFEFPAPSQTYAKSNRPSNSWNLSDL